MDISQKIKIIIKEADLYHSQGLLNEAESKYLEILRLFQKQIPTEHSEKIKKAIEKKIRDLDQEKKRVEKKVMSPHMTKESQDLITQMFVAADGKDSPAAKLEGAKALIKFGQFERAITELQHIINDPSVKLDVSKQIITCFVLSSRVDEGIQQIDAWISSDFLDQNQMNNVIKHARELFNTRGIEIDLPDPAKKTESRSPDPAESAESDNNLTLKKDSFFFEEDFEEYDILSSAKKPDKSGKKKP